MLNLVHIKNPVKFLLTYSRDPTTFLQLPDGGAVTPKLVGKKFKQAVIKKKLLSFWTPSLGCEGQTL